MSNISTTTLWGFLAISCSTTCLFAGQPCFMGNRGCGGRTRGWSNRQACYHRAPCIRQACAPQRWQSTSGCYRPMVASTRACCPRSQSIVISPCCPQARGMSVPTPSAMEPRGSEAPRELYGSAAVEPWPGEPTQVADGGGVIDPGKVGGARYQPEDGSVGSEQNPGAPPTIGAPAPAP